MAKALYVPCFPGELGWEAINYVPCVNYACSVSKFDEVHIVVRKGRQALYPMGTHFYPIDLSTSKSMGNSGHKPPSNDIVKELRSKFEVMKIDPLPPGCREAKRRKFLRYQASEDALHKWRHIPENAAVLCVRGRSFGKHKNWKGEKWKALCKYLLDHSFTPIVTGIHETVSFEAPLGCVDVRDKTTIEDFIAIAQRSCFVTGQSTGPAHLASLAGVPHAIWGSARIQDRYMKRWNPHKTPVAYLSCGNHFDGEMTKVIELIERLLDKIQYASSV